MEEQIKNDQEIERCYAGVAASKTFTHIVDTFGLAQKRVLDVGCSYGEFLIHFGPESVGITIAPEEEQYARAHGLRVYTGNIEDASFALPEEAPFSVVFANNIFEHLYSPHDFLIRIKDFLESDGTLVLGVPCIPYIVPLMRVRKFRGALASNHINFFTRTTLTKTVERAGWTVKTVRSFHFQHPVLDALLHPIAPHFYVVATPDPDFAYADKRARELRGYGGTKYATKT